MDLGESLRMAVKTLTANKLRSSLTMLGIVIGNASVIAMVGIGEGAQRYVNDQLQTLGPNVLFVAPGNRETRELGGLEIPRTFSGSRCAGDRRTGALSRWSRARI